MSAELFSIEGSPTGEKEAFVEKLGQAGLSYDSFCEILNRPLVDEGLIAEWVTWLNEEIGQDRQRELDMRLNNYGELHLSPDDRVLDVFEKLIGCRLTLWLVKSGMEYVHQLVDLTIQAVNASEELSYLDSKEWNRIQGLLISSDLLDADAVWPIGRGDDK